MYTFRIPDNKNKLDFVCSILQKLIGSLKEYMFINCTESPIEELNYAKVGNLYYRYVDEKNIKYFVDKSKYINSYKIDNIDKQGYSLDEYIELCILFELEEIKIIPKTHNNNIFDDIKTSNLFATLLICPDGLNEMQVVSESDVSIIIKVLENFYK